MNAKNNNIVKLENQVNQLTANNNNIVKLKNQVNQLIAKIQEIIKFVPASATAKVMAEFSNNLMAILRSERIFITEEEKQRHENGEDATINPENAFLDPSYIAGGSCTPILANSFGPWDPEAYFGFKGDKAEPRILWLLKEPFITKKTFDKGDRGGHNQALEYDSWDKIENEENMNTHINLINYTKKLLQELKGVEESDLNEALTMKHICILEVDHFPGLNFGNSKSDDDYIGQWVEINIDLIRELIHFYKPTIVIAGGTLQSIHDLLQIDSYNNVIIENMQNHKLLSNLGYEPDNNFATKDYIDSSNDYVIVTTNGPVFIQANHPSRGFNKKKSEVVAKRVREIMEKKMGASAHNQPQNGEVII